MKSGNRDWGPKSVCPAKIGTGRQAWLSAHFMRAETALGVDRRRGRRYTNTRLSWISISDSTRKMGQNEYNGKVYKAKLVSLDVGRDRETVAGEERRGTDCESQLPVLGPCVASDNVTVTGFDREWENNHLLSEYDIRSCCRSRLRGRTNRNNVNCLAGIHSAEARRYSPGGS